LGLKRLCLHAHRAAIVSLVGLPFLFYASALLNGGLLYGDALAQHLPAWVFSATELMAGRIPWWDPYVYGGQPHAGGDLAGFFYPLNALFLVLPPIPAANIMLLTPLSLVGLFVYLHVRDLSVTLFSAWIAGMTAALCAAMQTQLGHFGFTSAAGWFAVQLFIAHRMLRQLKLRYAWWLAIATAMLIVSSNPQLTAYALIAIAVYLAADTLDSLGMPRSFWRLVMPLASIAAGIGLTSMFLLPLLEVTSQSVRAMPDAALFNEGSYPPLLALTLFVPWMYGGGNPPFNVHYWGPLPAYWWEGLQYLGVAAVPLMVAAGLRFRVDARVRRYIVLASVLFVLAAGSYTPLYAPLSMIPLYNSLRISARYVVLWGPALAVLVGLGLDEIRLRRRGVRDMLIISLAAAVSLLVLGAIITSAADFAAFEGFVQQAVRVGLPAVSSPVLTALGIWTAQMGVLLIWTRVRKPGVSIICATLLAVLVFIDLGSFAWYLRSFQAEETILEPGNLTSCFGSSMPAPSLDVPARMAAVERIQTPQGTCTANYAMIARRPSVNGYDTLVQRRQLDWLAFDAHGESVQQDIVRQHAPVLDILGVRYLLAQSPKQASQQYGSLFYSTAPLSVVLSPHQTVRLNPGLVNANVVGMITWLANGTEVQQGEVVAEIRLTLADGSTRRMPLLAGLHTAEWAWDRPDLAGRLLHARASIAYDTPQTAGRYSGHAYLAEFPLGSEMAITSVEIASMMESASLALDRVSLSDTLTHETVALGTADILRGVDSYRELSLDSGLTVFENTHALPRAWLVNSLEVMTTELVRDAVLYGKMPDGRLFESSTIALAETPLATMNPNLASSDYAHVSAYEPGRIELEVSSKTDAFLVVSESYYPGWIATVDGQAADIVRTDYLVMGLHVPAGIHDVVLSYSPRIFALGAALSVLTLAVFAVGSILYGHTQHVVTVP
jgi:hypothetical protein